MKKLALLPFLFLLVACGGGGPKSLGAGEKLVVMASTLHLANIALAIAGDDASVELLPREGADPHSFEATADDRRRLERAHLLLVNGLKLESFDAAKLAESARVTLVNCSAKVPETFLLESEGEEAADGHKHDHDHAHGEHDPHLWLSTHGASHQADAIAEAMAAMDLAHADGYRARAREFKARLEKIREEYKGKIAALESRGFITDHDAFGYFAREFGLRNLGFLRKLPGKDPTIEERRALEKLIRESRARAIFTEPGHDAAASEAVAKSAGVKIAQLDPMEIGKPGKTAYEDTMKRNLQSVIEALK